MYGYLRHLANFAHIVEAGSMTGAANKLECSPSSMSESVKILEAYFNQPLLERRQRGVLPTGKGASIYEDCQLIVQAHDNAMGVSSDELSGKVKVSIPAEFLFSFGTRFVADMKKRAPSIQLVLAAENEILDHTKFARDLYVRVAKSKEHPNLTILHSNPEEVVLIGNSELLKGKDIHDVGHISKLTFLGGLNTHSGQTLKLVQPSEELTFTDTIQIGSTEARIAMMRENAGITACLKSTVSTDLKNGSIVRILPNRFGFPLYTTIGSPHRNPNSAARLVAEVLASTHQALVK